MAILEGLGRRTYPPLLSKRVRDEVCWKDAELPWRRSPFWLVLRVCVRRLLSFSLNPEAGRLLYKLAMCVVHAQLLQDCGTALKVEERSFLRAKLCRRLAKLEAERANVSDTGHSIYNTMFPIVERECEMVVHQETKRMSLDWEAFKQTIRRHIPSLPMRSNDLDSKLRLGNCLQHLERVLKKQDHNDQGQPCGVVERPMGNDSLRFPVHQPQPLAARIISLVEQEEWIKRITFSSATSAEQTRCCEELARMLDKYMESGLESYQCSVEQRSLMVLLIFELWVVMDQCAVKVFPLLKEYHPAFPPGILDVLQLVHWEEMVRMRRVQEYLSQRCEQCPSQSTTIFADPFPKCFAVRYIDLDRSGAFEVLKQTIEHDASEEREAKLGELYAGNTRYYNLTQQIDTITCSCNCDKNGRRNGKRCHRCIQKDQRKKLRIGVHEHPMPTIPVQQKAVLFELAIPASFAAYRDTTWSVLTGFGIGPESVVTTKDPPKTSLYEYTQLLKYRRSSRTRLALASTSKSFLVTHYKNLRLPSLATNVLVPFGLKLSYYDNKLKFWTKELELPVTFTHHFGLDQSVLTLLNIKDASPFTADASSPTSYEIVASRTKCPPGLTMHEFMAYQTLLSGRNTRWLSILRELGSSNLNFSLEQTLHVCRHLCLQVGPTVGQDKVPVSYVVFQDEGFCRQLLAQIARHLGGVSRNWRESYYMELLLILILRLCNLAPEKYVQGALGMIKQVRRITLQWIQMLREATHSSESPDINDSRMYAMLASILCKRTFLLAVESQQSLNGDELECFVLASIALQDNSPASVSSPSSQTRGMLIRDFKMTLRLQPLLRQAIQLYPRCLDSAIRATWPGAVGLSKWEFLPPPWEGWVVSTVQSTEFTSLQTVHYHLLDGSLLVNNRPIGSLPTGLRESPIVRELFGDECLRTFPSALPGMSYVLSTSRGGHEVHFGLRKGKPVIQARLGPSLIEFVSRDVFGTGSSADLPTELLEDCVHWLNFKTGELECRRRPNTWKRNRPGNWILDLRVKRAYRRNAVLIDPQSDVARRIAGVFQHFEDAKRLTIFQPSQGRLTVELKHLTFRVNQRRLLESSELRCEIDPDQDAGTWYGLQSLIVVRDARNSLQRAIIVPIGELNCSRCGDHITARIGNDGRYSRYHINWTLGRLECAPEPLLLFTKAQLHAYTSFAIPDPLTKRTGTEEALACLSSGAIQPWTVLESHQLRPLLSLAQLAPRRKYYPEHLRKQQSVRWDNNLTVTIQHDAYRPAVDTFFAKFGEMAMFADGAVELPEWAPETAALLRQRGLNSRLRLERVNTSLAKPIPTHDHQYQARDILRRHAVTDNISEIVHLIIQRPALVNTSEDLGLALQAPLVKGYKKRFSHSLFGDLLRDRKSVV